jgi:hypothetical protein
MKRLIIALLVLASTSAMGQFRERKPAYFQALNFSTQKPISLKLQLPKAYSSITLYNTAQLTNNISPYFLTPAVSGQHFWSGGVTTFYSKNRMFRTDYTYDMLGNVRDSRISFSFPKRN